METEIRSFVLDVITNVMSFKLPESAGDDMMVGPGGIDLDSLSLLELMSAMEKKYGFKVPDEDYEALGSGTLGELVKYISGRRAAATA